MAVGLGFSALFQALLAGFALPFFLMCLVSLSSLFRSVGGVPDRAYEESTRKKTKTSQNQSRHYNHASVF